MHKLFTPLFTWIYAFSVLLAIALTLKSAENDIWIFWTLKVYLLNYLAHRNGRPLVWKITANALQLGMFRISKSKDCCYWETFCLVEVCDKTTCWYHEISLPAAHASTQLECHSLGEGRIQAMYIHWLLNVTALFNWHLFYLKRQHRIPAKCNDWFCEETKSCLYFDLNCT